MLYAMLMCMLSQSTPDQTVKCRVPEKVLDGEALQIVVEGLPAGTIARLHVLRTMEKWQNEKGSWKQVKIVFHSWAEYTANEQGKIVPANQVPLKGTITTTDELSLLRNGYRLGDAALSGVYTFPVTQFEKLTSSQIKLIVEQQGKLVAEAETRIVQTLMPLSVEVVATPGLHGVYARPKQEGKYPVVIQLHGSEGGSIEKATSRATQFASRGYACLAINYFNYSHEATPGVPTENRKTPLEMIDLARTWLEKRSEVKLYRIALHGVSKGAEFSLLAAAQYPWIHSVIAVVPSDIVWEGYGEKDPAPTPESSWSWEGKQLPFVRLFSYDPNREGMYRTNTERYDRSREFFQAMEKPARIPVEKIKARILLLASDRDEVWSSGRMARNIVEQLTEAGMGKQVSVRIYPTAGHMISGTGTFPVRLYGVQAKDPLAKDIVAEGDASADAWKKTLRFLKSMQE